MSSGKLDKFSQESIVRPDKIVLEKSTDFSQIIIPFTKMFKSHKSIDIYSGSGKNSLQRKRSGI